MLGRNFCSASTENYLESFKSHIEVIEAHNEAVGYHPSLAAVAIKENHNVNSNATNEEQKIKENTKARKRYIMCLLLVG